MAVSVWVGELFVSLVIPFMLIFAIVYGLLSRAKLFGEASKKINVILALALAIAGSTLLAEHSTIALFSSSVTLFGIAAVVLLVIGGASTGQVGDGFRKFLFLAVFAMILIFFFVKNRVASQLYLPPIFAIGLLGALAFAAVLFFVFKSDSPAAAKSKK